MFADHDKIGEAMVDALRVRSCRSLELFQEVGVDARVGREIISNLIDAGRVVVETDWTLRAR